MHTFSLVTHKSQLVLYHLRNHLIHALVGLFGTRCPRCWCGSIMNGVITVQTCSFLCFCRHHHHHRQYTLVQWWRHFIILLYQHVVNWFQTNQPDHESDDRPLFLCFTHEKDGILSTKFKHLSLYCGSVKPKLQTGPEYMYWFLWESCEMWFLQFTDNIGIVSSKIHLKAVAIFVPLQSRGAKRYV